MDTKRVKWLELGIAENELMQEGYKLLVTIWNDKRWQSIYQVWTAWISLSRLFYNMKCFALWYLQRRERYLCSLSSSNICRGDVSYRNNTIFFFDLFVLTTRARQILRFLIYYDWKFEETFAIFSYFFLWLILVGDDMI